MDNPLTAQERIEIVEIHQLRYFLSICQTGSFTAAAELCHISQPSLSVQISKLEEELGGSLFERSRQGARLTARGELLKPRAAETLQQLLLVRSDMDAYDGLARGSVRLGCLPATGAHILPVLLGAYQIDHPEIDIQLKEESSPGLSAALLNYEIDIAVTDEAGLDRNLEAEVLFSEELLAALPLDHPLALRSELDLQLQALKNESFIIMKEGHGFHRIVMQALQQQGISPQIVYESAEIETVQGLVGAGLGVSLVPKMVRKAWGIAYRRIAVPRPSRTLFLACRSFADLSPAAQALRETAQQHLQNFGV
ncbi:LysR family transcriptional regulator [Spirochaeta dissipatitropha]